MAIRKYSFVASLAAVALVCFPAGAGAKQSQAKKTQTIEVESAPPSTAFVNTTYHAVVKASSGLPVSINTEESPSVCSVSGTTVTFKASGICHIDFNQAGNEEYEPAPELKRFTEVKTRSQTITFTSKAPSNATVGGATYTVSATATSGQTVAFSSGTPSACTVSGSTVSFVGSGTCTLDANQAGNGEYSAAPQSMQSFPVAKKTQTVTFTSTPNEPRTGGTYAVSATASSGLAVSFASATTSVCTVSGSTVSFLATGGCTIVASQAGNEQYEPAETTQSFKVAKRTQTVSFTSSAPAHAIVEGPTYAVSATSTSGLAAAFSSATTSVCTVSGSTVSFVGAGTCMVVATQTGNEQYEPAPEAKQSFTVKRAQTISFTSAEPSAARMGDPAYTAAATASSGLPVAFSSATDKVCTVSGASVTYVHAGTCTIVASQAGNAEYEPAPQAQQSFAVHKGRQAVKISSKPPEPANVGETYALAATGGPSGNPVTYKAAGGESACTVAGSTVEFVGSGTCTVDAEQAGSEDYEPAEPATQSIAVKKVTQTIKFTSTAPSKATVGGAAYTVTASATSHLPVALKIDTASGSACSLSGSTVSFSHVGMCTIDAEQTGDSKYEPAPPVQQSFAVAKGSQTISFTSTPPNPARYGGTYALAVGASSGLPVTLTTATPACTVSGTTVSFVGTGECVIDANQAGNENYEPAPEAKQSFTIVKAPQTITLGPPPSNPSVGAAPYAVSAMASSGLPVTLTTATPACTVSGTKVSFVGTGECVIDANQAGNENYEPATQATQSFSVSKGAQEITFTSNPPSPANPGGTYMVTVTGGGSKEPVKLSSPTPSVCVMTGATTVSFKGTGECVIDANEAGNVNYNAAEQKEQTFPVTAASEHQIIVVTPPPTGSGSGSGTGPPIKQVGTVTVPDSNFRVVGASLSLSTYAITFMETVVDSGTFTWVLTFENGKYGVYAAKTTHCRSGSIRLKGKCRPSRILFAKGSETIAAGGNVTFTVKPTGSGVAAMKRAFKQHKGLPVIAVVKFQSAQGGQAVTRVQSLVVKGRR